MMMVMMMMPHFQSPVVIILVIIVIIHASYMHKRMFVYMERVSKGLWSRVLGLAP